MNLGTSPTNALTSYRTTTFSIALAANLRLEIEKKLLILLVSKDGFLRPSNVTAGFRQSGTLLVSEKCVVTHSFLFGFQQPLI